MGDIENMPLTIGQIMLMDGEPVWLDQGRAWRLVSIQTVDKRPKAWLWGIVGLIDAEKFMEKGGHVYSRKLEEVGQCIAEP